METVTVLRDVLIEDLKTRQEAHRQSWEMACRAKDELIVREMRRLIRVFKRTGVLGKLVTTTFVDVGFQPPGAGEYRRAISFIEIADDEILLSESQVDRWVEDRWDWTADWLKTCKTLGVI